jgi:hypothetical protein
MILGGDFGLKKKKQRRGVPLNDAILQSILAWFREPVQNFLPDNDFEQYLLL